MVMIDRIAELQKESGLSVRQFEMCINAKNGSFSSWVKGKYCPSIDAIIGIANYCNVTTDYLLGLSDNRRIENALNPQEQLLIKAFNMADIEGQNEIIWVCRNEIKKAEARLIQQEGKALS